LTYKISKIIGEHTCEGRATEKASATPILFFGGSATAVSAFKVSAKNGLFLGQMARTPFEWSLKGYIRNDPRISHFLRLRTLGAAAFFWLLYFLLLKKESLARRDSSQKPSRRWREACFFSSKRRLEGTCGVKHAGR